MLDTKEEITGKKVGTVSVSMYEESFTGSPIYLIEPENRHVLPLSHVIEDTLNHID